MRCEQEQFNRMFLEDLAPRSPPESCSYLDICEIAAIDMESWNRMVALINETEGREEEPSVVEDPALPWTQGERRW